MSKDNKEEKKQEPATGIEELLSNLQDRFGEGAIMKLGDAKKVNVDVIPTGSFSLDLALGVGGLPKGRIVEIYGPESGGKTTLALNVVAQSQKKGGKAALIDVIVIDSVAALTPKAEIEGEMGAQFMGLQARMMSQALRKLTAITSKANTTIIFINQLREKIGMMFGNPETTPGGRALKFFSSVRIDVRRIAQVKKGEEIVGSRVK